MQSPSPEAEDVELLTPLRFALRCWYALLLLVAADENELIVPQRPPHGYAVLLSCDGTQGEDGWHSYDNTDSRYVLKPRRLDDCRCGFCRQG
jgi:hypothetical protein